MKQKQIIYFETNQLPVLLVATPGTEKRQFKIKTKNL